MKGIVVIFATLLLVSCTAQVVRDDGPQTVYETGSAPIIYFCPQDNCSEKFLLMLSGSKDVDCAFYSINSKSVVEGLAFHSARVVIDKDNENDLKKNKILYETNYGGQLSHNKFCVFDKHTVWTGSWNPSEKLDNNNIIIISSRYLSDNYENEFEEMWDGWYGGGKKVQYPIVYFNGNRIENYFCPEDCEGALQRILQLIKSSRKSIVFMTYSFTEDSIGNAIIEKHRQGVMVKGLFEKSANSRYNEYSKMKEAGIDARFDRTKSLMHHKVFIIDEEIVITGSWNPSKGGTTKNDENILILFDKEIAKKYIAEFERLWPITA